MWQRFANDVQALADTGKRTKNFLDRLEKVERDEKMRRTLADRYAPRAILRNSGAILSDGPTPLPPQVRHHRARAADRAARGGQPAAAVQQVADVGVPVDGL